MSIGIRFLKLAAKVGLDLLIGSKRTDEAIQLFEDWTTQGKPTEIEHEVAEAKHAVEDPRAVKEAVNEAVADAGVSLSPEQRDALAFTLSTGIGDMPLALTSEAGAARLLMESLLPGKTKTYVLWLDHPKIVGKEKGRYCHFNWDGESYRIRDYIGGRIFHPAGRTVTGKELQPVALDLTAMEIWNAGKGRVQCLKRFGLSFPVTERERWTQVLELLTATAEWK